jgi:hypothetical protein
MLALLLLATDPTAPRPGPIKTFGDWEVACDNVHRCEMTSLTPEQEMVDGTGGEVSLSIVRQPGPAGSFTIEVGVPDSEKGEVSVRVDDQVIGGGDARDGTMTLRGDVAAQIVTAMINGHKASLTDIGGADIGRLSLAGSAAALRFIDSEQGRAGGVTAAVAKGPKPASTISGALPLPQVPSVMASGKPAPVTPALRKAMLSASSCDADDSNTKDALSAWALGGGKTLMLLPCGAGAYNFSSVAFVVEGGKPVLARFDSPAGFGEDRSNTMLVNADWDAKKAQLTSYAKGRGLGDCGSSETYVWDGTRFRLIEATQMGECRGSINWLTIWRATPVKR